MDMLIILAALGLFGLVTFWPRHADAHCDTMDGPTAVDGRKALTSGNLNHALKWIGPKAEAELREVFEPSLRVRKLGGEATAVADRLFLETLVRLHRAGEGAGFDGLKPSGTAIDPAVAAADAAIASGRMDPLVGVAPKDRLPELERRLQAALALKDFPVDDVAAGRRYIDAYVKFFKYAEGHDHDHGHGGHAHQH
ncbi:DUF6448 family protein [Neoroseomonas soli]|uniref:Uncharacterized protein n=1 Tax=Neoroseomonas soli TaxID=1081025 RepID=A0A9X9X401_9PROT|nr:DUF6448 family protein [Neoroseomonas soli]MBR0674130.1 hypothetical protein [Neoroseomonas soli]